MTDNPTHPDVQIVAKFSIWKLLVLCGPIIAFAGFCWTQIPGLDDYQGHRYSTEFGRFLLISATVIATAFLPLVAWHVWNVISRPAALYASGGRLFFYWAFFRSVSIADITDTVDLGRSSPFGDSIRVSLSGRPDLMFQTTFMSVSGCQVAAAIRKLAAIQT